MPRSSTTNSHTTCLDVTPGWAALTLDRPPSDQMDGLLLGWPRSGRPRASQLPVVPFVSLAGREHVRRHPSSPLLSHQLHLSIHLTSRLWSAGRPLICG